MLLTWSHTCLNESWVLWWERRGGQGYQTESLDSLNWRTVYRLKAHYWDHFRICITAFWHKEVKAQVRIWIHVDCFHLIVLGFCFRLLSLLLHRSVRKELLGSGYEADQIWPCKLRGGLQCPNSFYVTVCAYTSTKHHTSFIFTFTFTDSRSHLT